MKTLLNWFIFLGIGIGIGIFLSQDPGYVLFSYSGWVLEIPLLLAGFLVFLLVTGFYLLLRTGHFVFDLPHRIKRWFSRRKEHKAWLKTIRGLKAFFTEDWSKAEALLSQSATKHTALLCYLVCARAAEEQDAIERRDRYLQLAHKVQPQDAVTVGLTQAALQFSHKQYEQSLATVMRLKEVAARHPSVLKLRQQLCVVLKDWKELRSLLPLLSKYAVVSDTRLDLLRKEMFGELLKEALHQKDFEAVETVWRDIPTYLQQEFTLQKAYANVLFRLPKHLLLENFIRRAASKHWDSELITLYSLLEGTVASKQLAIAEVWLEDHPRDSELLLCLGRLCLKNKLWGKAKRYLETSIQVFPTAVAYYELARLNEALGDETSKRDCFRQGLALATGPVPPLPLPAAHPSTPPS